MKPTFAPLNLLMLTVPESSFRVAENPADSMRMELDVTPTFSEIEEDDEHDEYALAMSLSVHASLVNTEDEDDVRAEARVRVESVVSVPRQIGDPGRGLDYLKLNGTSISYGHARSYLMPLASMSPMSSFVLPAIVPSAMLGISDMGEEDPQKAYVQV